MITHYGSLPIHSPKELFVIGDIHGENERLKRLLDLIIPELSNKENHLVFCGDYTNHKGPSSPKVLLKLVEIKKMFPDQIFFLIGNHEEMVWQCLNRKFGWFQYAEVALKQMMLEWEIPHNELKPLSYISEIYEECEKRGIIDFYLGLIPYYETDTVICTHAPLDRIMCQAHGLESYKIEFQENNVRKYFLDRMRYEITWGNTAEDNHYLNINIDKTLVCGHQFKYHKQPRLFKKRVFLDTGCGVSPGKPLVALRLPSKKIIKESF